MLMEFLETVFFFTRIFWHCVSPKAEDFKVVAHPWMRLSVLRRLKNYSVGQKSVLMVKYLVTSMLPFGKHGRLNLAVEAVCILMWGFKWESVQCAVLGVISWCFGQGCIEQWLPLSGEFVQENHQGEAAVWEARDKEGNSLGNVQGIFKQQHTNMEQKFNWFDDFFFFKHNLLFFSSTTRLSAAFWMRKSPLPLPQSTGGSVNVIVSWWYILFLFVCLLISSKSNKKNQMHFITGASDFNYHPKQFFKNTVMWLWYVCIYIIYLNLKDILICNCTT